MKRILYIFVVLIIIFIGFKNCFISPVSNSDYFLLESSGNNGQKVRLLLTPNNEMIVVKRFGNNDELGLFKIKGENAIHYFGSLYFIGSFPMGLRFLKNAEKVYNTECELIKRV